MPDYIYLLENRLSSLQQNALRTVRDLARDAQMTVFLTGEAIRDLTLGAAIRDLEVVVNGNALDLKDAIVAAGGKVWGEDAESRTLYTCFPGLAQGNVRLDLRSSRRVEYPKAGKPVYQWASIQEDLRSRDFTINAMAISLNEGSYGLLMDPANGAADIEARLLRLVSNYGFLDNPVVLIRATRLQARLGFELEERTLTRYENAKGDEVIEHLSDLDRRAELELIGHEEEPLKILHAFEAEGWTGRLFAPWTAAKADADKLTALHDLANELRIQGVHPDLSAAQMQLLTVKLAAKDLADLKGLMLRPGFVEEWNNLDARAAEFSKALMSKENASPSATHNLFLNYAAEAVLWLGFTSKQAAVKEKFENFLKVWPQARQRIPYALMLEMRITPELPGYQDLVKTIFLQLIDGGLGTTEEMRALLEPHSPPAPPPPVTIKRTRAKKGEAKAKARQDDDDEDDDDGDGADDEDDDDDDDDIDSIDLGSDDLDLSLGMDGRKPMTGGDEADGEEEDAFARDSVGDEDLDAEESSGADDERDDDLPVIDQKPSRRKGSGGKASVRSESKDDDSTAAGAGLKALAFKLDLLEPDDPADLDEADPTIEADFDDDGDDSDDDYDDADDDVESSKSSRSAPAKKAVAKGKAGHAVKAAPAAKTKASAPAKGAAAKTAAKSAKPAKAAPASKKR